VAVSVVVVVVVGKFRDCLPWFRGSSRNDQKPLFPTNKRHEDGWARGRDVVGRSDGG
jgi:hypothetical protein